MKAFQRSSSATDMKVFQRISGALDTETFQRISSATDGGPGKDGERRKKNVLWHQEEQVTDKKNEEKEAVDFETEYDKRHKSQQKQG